MTQLEIINLALSHIGQNPITQTQLDNNSHPSAIAANTYWVPCRDEVLGESNWSFANTTLALSAVSAVTDVVWDYCFTYPTLAVGSVWNVFDEGTIDTKEDQKFEVKYVPSQSNKCIFSNLEHAYAEYTYKVTDPEIWSQKFAMAFSYRLASSIAVPIGAGVEMANNMAVIYNGIIQEAKRLGASEKVKKPNQDSGYINSR